MTKLILNAVTDCRAGLSCKMGCNVIVTFWISESCGKGLYNLLVGNVLYYYSLNPQS